MDKKVFSFLIILFLIGISIQQVLAADLWDYAWSENIGWIKFESHDSNAHWELVNDDIGSADGYGTYVWNNSIIPQADAYKLEDPFVGIGGNINNVIVHTIYGGGGKSGIRLSNGNESFSGNFAANPWNIHSAIIPRPGGGAWTWDDIRNMQVIAISYKTGPFNGEVTQVYVEVDYVGGNLILKPNGEGDYTNIANPDPSILSPEYGVEIDSSTGIFSGYAWSENIGWISFYKDHLTGCPSAPCEAKIDLTTGEVSGWANPLFSKRYEYFNSLAPENNALYEKHWNAQTFTVGTVGENESFNVTSVKIKANRFGSPGAIVASIRSMANLAGGPDLCSGSVNGNLFGLNSEWHEIPINPGNCVLSPGTQYALVIRAPDGSEVPSNLINWDFDPAGTYGGGNRKSSNDFGVTWADDPGDFKFEIHGSALDKWISLNGVTTGGDPYEVSLDNTLFPNEFEGWAWGGGNVADDSIIGWISFNGDNEPGGADYSVKTNLFATPPNTDPVADFSCALLDDTPIPACEAFFGEGIKLINESTDPDSANPPDNNDDIVQSEWFVKEGANPYNLIAAPCPGVCNSFYGAIGNYTVKLKVTDSNGAFDEIEKPIKIKQDISANFVCSTDNVVWQECNAIMPLVGSKVYLKDNSSASEGAVINSRTWEEIGVGIFDVDNDSDAEFILTISPTDIKLTADDTANRGPVSIIKTINGAIPLPTWREIAPF